MSAEIRVSVGTWARGLYYPRHAHEPAEVYCVIAGNALFLTDGQPDARLGPGETRTHPPHISHAARMDESPLLAMAIWRGAELTENPVLDPADLA